MAMGVLRWRKAAIDLTRPYGALEAWLYDRLVGSATTEAGLNSRLFDEFLSACGPGARLLDVGCGGGQLALAIARRRPDAQVTGLDLSPEQTARATRRARQLGLAERARFVTGSALRMPFPDRSFDGVLSLASLKHWPDPARGLSECFRVLRPGGRLLLVEADRESRRADAEAFVARWRVPAITRPLALRFFYRRVVPLGVDRATVRALLGASSFGTGDVGAVPGLPAVVVRATR